MAMAKWVTGLLSFLNGFRKLVICMIVLVLATVFVCTGHITGEQFASIMTVTVPSYFAGNIGEHLTSSVKEWLQKKTS